MLNRDKGFRRPLSVCFLLGLFCLTLAAGFQPPVPSLQGYWPGDDGVAPSSAADASGNGNSGTYNNATTSSSAAPVSFTNPTSMSFTGSNSTVSVPGFSWPASGGPVTVSYWSLVAQADVKNSSSFSVGNLDSPNRFQAHAPWGDGFLYWDYGTYTTGSGRVLADYSPFYGAWTHVALTSYGALGTGQAIYFNGTQAASVSTSVGPTSASPLNGLTIGGWPAAGLYVKGQIDDFRIYNRVLTDPEIAALAAGAAGPAAPTGLTAVPGNFSVALSWNDSTGPGPLSYSVGRSSTPGGSPPGTYTILTSGLTSPTYIDTTVTNGTSYYYVVYEVSFGSSPASNEASTTPNASVVTPTGGKGETNCGATGLEVLLPLGLLGLWRRRRRWQSGPGA